MIKWFKEFFEVPKNPPPEPEITERCPPCHGNCNQGRDCNWGGALPKESFGELAEYWRKTK
jgi:hypothetical protein